MKIEQLMNQHYAKFSENDRYICTCILHHKEDCMRLSIDEFARTYHMSPSSLSRFAQKLSLPGYSELKVILHFEKKDQVPSLLESNYFLHNYDEVIEMMEKKDCEKLFLHMVHARRIIVFGDGYHQGRVAKEMKRIFLPSGKVFYDMYGLDMIDPLSQLIQEGDVVILISMHGNTKEVIEFAKNLHLRGVYLASLTIMESNPLSHVCDENFYIQTLHIEIDTRQYEVTTPYFILIELLYVKYKMFCLDEHTFNT